MEACAQIILVWFGLSLAFACGWAIRSALGDDDFEE